MKQNKNRIALIDKLTNSIVNRITGDSFDTTALPVFAKELVGLQKKGWNFNWTTEFKKYTVVKLVIQNNESIIQGLMSFDIRKGYIEIDLLESSPFNIGKNKVYEGVAGNLFAYACKVSFEKGYDGYVAFTAKSQLTKHYETAIGAEIYHPPNRMAIDTPAATKLVKQYFPNFFK